MSEIISCDHLTIQKTGTMPSGKTHIYTVRNRHSNTLIGMIRWWAPWRKYTFQPQSDTIWDADCLREVTNALDTIMLERSPAHSKLQKEAAAAMVGDMYGGTD